jgi:hypothetical protein
MSRSASASNNKVIPLPAVYRSEEAQRTSAAAGQLRRQLSLLQGYADLMDGLSPEQHVQIMRVMADKIHELTEALQPFVDPAGLGEEQPLDQYRIARSQTRRLLSDYRLLLRRLRETVHETHVQAAPLRRLRKS